MGILGLVIIGILILIVILVLNTVDDIQNSTFDTGVFFGIILSILIAIEVALLSSVLEDPRPTAMDVYQGKTTLEYTIRDSVKIDSIVVFKDSLIIN
jgi:hypothetical protein